MKARARRQQASAALTVALPPWVVARAIVLPTLALAHYIVDHSHPSAAGVAFRVHQGLLGWDAGFYQAIAAHGYGGLSHQALRFFPLVPLLTRGLSEVTRLSAGQALLVVSNLSALVAGALLYQLARLETGDDALARRAAWLIALVPPAFVLVMGYSEATMLVILIAGFLALRTRHWGWAILAGLLAGLVRPVGVLLAVPAAVEAARRLGEVSWRERVQRAGAVLAPVAGCAAYLGWVGARYGDPWLPLQLQTSSSRHGGLADPLRTLWHNFTGLLHGHHVGSGLHVPWAVLMVALLVVSFMRWPASYGAMTVAVLAVALSSTNLDSIERYALGAFPLVLAGASLTASRRVERAVYALSGAGMAGYALLAFLNASVP